MNTLISLYKKNIIVYPRTESDYIADEKLLSYLAHPKLNNIGDFFSPLQKKEYEFDEKSLLLELHNRRILTPANLQSVGKKLTNRKSSGVGKKDKRQEATLEYYNSFLQDIKQKEKDYFINSEISHYRSSKNKMLLFKEYEINNVSDVFNLKTAILEKSRQMTL